MIKKKIICTSIVLSVAILSNLYSTPKDDPYEDPNKKEHIAFIESKIEEKRRNALEIYTFANESAPLDNKNVKQKLDKYLSRSEEHTSELQSRENLVCRLQLEK